MGILERIVEKKRERLVESKRRVPLSEIRAKALDAGQLRGFSEAIKRQPGENIKLIAEIKRSSPSKGILRTGLNVVDIAKIYRDNRASAISVLTEADFFMGEIKYLGLIRESVKLPLLMKDFIFDEYQIYEAMAYGADAVLLIATILEKGRAEELFHLSGELGLSVLFEVHDHKELETALKINVPVIGINNRNLSTLTIDLNTTVRLLGDIPEGKTVVSESGIESRSDVEFFEKTEVDALLVGTAFMKAPDIGGKVRELFRC